MNVQIVTVYVFRALSELSFNSFIFIVSLVFNKLLIGVVVNPFNGN